MNKKYIPYAHAQKIYDINPNFFVKINARIIFLDLDNTLARHYELEPSKETLVYLEKLKNLGIKLIIISNNKEKRVKRYATLCGIEYIFKTGKPNIKKLNRYIIKNNIDKKYVIMIGDQLLTDVVCSNKLGVRCILTERLWNGDQFITKFIRWFDFIKRNKLRKFNLLTEWEDIYGRIK